MGWARLRVAAASRNCLPFFTAARPSYISNLFTPNAAPRLAVQRFSCGWTSQNSPLRRRHPATTFQHDH
ncbi:hypothetical protein BSU04_06570 [Caballeronia sordidicola]|uniref:Uncharacterized protein n=1 Tax=Caballeronia sordidicola TaxID=196367 RepID=A0A226X8E4_CABSO|nr:hypothetical protein BSU04_06570 [Caballeronia sordidicola]